MSSQTPNLNLRKPAATDQVNVQTDLNDNFDKLDLALSPGTFRAMVPAPGGVDDTAVVQAAIDAAVAARAGDVQLAAGTYVCTTLTLYGGVHLVGAGIGGDVFSNTDAGFPFRGTVLKLKNGTNADLVKTENFASLTGVASPSTYDVPERYGLRHLVLDGNNGNNSSGWPLRMYGRAYRLDGIVVQNGASGGIYSEGPTGGYDMESKWSDFDIVRCGGISLDFQGPHDSQFVNGTVKAPSGTPSPTYGIKIGGRVGGEQFTNVHVWGGFTVAHWEIGTNVGQFLNCYSDGNGIVLLGSGNTWDGLILGTNTPGQYAVKLGDGTTRTLGQNTVRGRVTGFKGSPYAIQTPGTTCTGNRYEAVASMGGVTRYAAKGNVYTTTGAVVAGAVTVPLSATADLPASGTLYADDGINRTVALVYSGKTVDSITGVTGVPAGGLDSGAAVWLSSALFTATDFGGDSFEIWDYDNAASTGLVLRRPTPTSQAIHTGLEVFTGKTHAQEGIILADFVGTQAAQVHSGVGAPTAAATAGDYYFRTDSSGTTLGRIYICTGGSTWVDLFTLPQSAITGLVAALAAKEPLDPDTLTLGESTMGRRFVNAVNVAQGSQALRLAFFTAHKSETITQVRFVSGSTLAAATPTICRIGLYTVDAGTGDITLVASTPNDTALWAGASTTYTKSFSAGYAKVAGQRYAVGTLVVTAAAAPTTTGFNNGLSGNEAAIAPRLGAVVGSMADLPASVVAGSLGASGQLPYVALLP